MTKPVPTLTVGLLVSLVIALTPSLVAANASTIEVKVERVKPAHPKHETLRFLRENKDFLRARLDLLRQTSREGRGGSDALDPRFLAYQRMMADALAAQDSVARAEDARDRQTLLAHVAELAALEHELDAMDELLGAQRGRLAELEADFTGRQETALAILVRGMPAAGTPAELTLVLEDSTVVHVPLSAEQRRALAEGGIAQVYHGFVEPRSQVIEASVVRGAGAAPESSWITLEPGRDRLTFLELDLSGLDGADPATRLRASAWPLMAQATSAAR
jgi:hypothetical protein